MDFLYIILIPISLTILFYAVSIIKKRKIDMICYLVSFVFSSLLGLSTYMIMIRTNVDDIEYLGSYVTHIIHYDDWDEWVHRTCSRRVPSGRDSNGNTIYRTEYYDCSYRDYHPEKWVMYDNMNKSYNISKNQFNEIKNIFNSEMIFVDMKRHYYSIDGDAQKYNYNGEKERIYGLTHSSHYKNKTKTKYTIYCYENLDKEDIVDLYEYPKINNHMQNPIIGIKNITKNDIYALNYVNSLYGKKKQIRVFLLGYYNKEIEISERQKIYWEGGNKNELIICLGLDSVNNVKWCNVFSWCDKPELDLQVKNYFNTHEGVLNIPELADNIEGNISKWERKQFKDFEYITVNLTSRQFYVTIFLVLLSYLTIFMISVSYKDKF